MKYPSPYLLQSALHQVLFFSLSLQIVYREAKLIFPTDSTFCFAKRLLTVFWCFPFLRQASAWLESANNPLLARELMHMPKIREYLYRPYVNRYWKPAKRLAVIEEHYGLVNNNASFLDLAPDEYIDLLVFNLGFDKLRVVLDRPSWMRREGEIGLSLFLGINRIYTVMFLLSGSPGNMKLIVGSVQGTHIKPAQNEYKLLTKTLYGIRPRDFLIHITKMISDELGCTEILGVSDAAHRSSHLFSRANKHISYNAIWLEHGGEKSGKDFFKLVPKFIKRKDTNIAARKRALYRRRYQFLDELRLLLKWIVASPPPKKVHLRICESQVTNVTFGN
jgi:uncharacterized protein VirK/YbjX